MKGINGLVRLLVAACVLAIGVPAVHAQDT